jgi:PAS domain S-box-containing protein
VDFGLLAERALDVERGTRQERDYFLAQPSGRARLLHSSTGRLVPATEPDPPHGLFHAGRITVDGLQLRVLSRPAEGTLDDRRSAATWWLLAANLLFTALAVGLLLYARHSQRRLGEQQTLYRLLAENANDVIWVLDLQTRRFRYVSPSIEKLRGYTAEEVMAGPIEATIAPEALDGILQTIEAVAKQAPGAPTGGVADRVPQPRRDGTIVWTEVSTRVVRNEETGHLELFGISRDVSEKLAAEQKLRVSEARYRALFDALPVAVTVTDPQGRVLESNRLAERILGMSTEKQIETGLAGLLVRVVRPDGTAMAADEFAPARALRERRPVENVAMGLLGEGGAVTWLTVTAAPIPLADHGVAVAYVDVSWRYRAERALRESEQRFRSFYDLGLIGMAIAALDQTVLQANDRLCEMLGYSREELLGRSFRDLTHPEDRGLEEADHRGLLAGRLDRYSCEKRYQRKDGSTIHVHISVGCVRDERGQPLYHVGMVQDITERRQAEQALAEAREQLLQSQKLQAVGRLAGGVAHDFNNLLGVIHGHAELALRALPEPHALRGRLDEILAAATRGASLTRQLLAFSRRQVLQPRVVDLNQVVGETASMLQRLIGEDVELAIALAPELGRVEVDPGQIAQVLVNLAVNARDAMPQGGVLTVETGNLDADAALAAAHPPMPPGRYVQLRVSDTGVGMDETVLSHAFEPFFTTKPEGEGTGLGLSTVYGIVSQSGGFIWIRSQPGRGTSLLISLPRLATDADAPSAVPRPDAPRAGGAETILVVEDQDSLRELIGEMLDDAGHTVLSARDGREALALAEARPGPIDLLLTDVIMPGMSGRELVERLLVSRPGLRALFMSGYTAEVLGRSGVAGTSVALLEKPFDRATLLRRVREALES